MGRVLEPEVMEAAEEVAAYNELVAKDHRLESVVVPIRDGLSVARVK